MASQTCPGPVSRRQFLRLGILGLGGLSQSHLLAARAAAGRESRDTSVILFWMWGGPSQLETYDMKPDAPSEYRGPFRPIKTSVPGMEICELFPLKAKLGNKISLIRSLHHGMSAHNDGSIQVLTGKTPAKPDPTSLALSEHPDFGMIASRVRGAPRDGVPSYVGIPRQPFMTRPTYLGLNCKGFDTGDPSIPNFKAPNLSFTSGVNKNQFGKRQGLLNQFDHFRHGLAEDTLPEGTDKFHNQAVEMLTNPAVARAFDIQKEDPRVRDRYGRHLWGQSCLLARRLAEAGSTVVTIDALAPTLSDRYFSWDDHLNPITGWGLKGAMMRRAPFMDQGLSALIEDIYQRGLDRKIMVVALGEFGRTPRLTHADNLLGRDHWPDAQSALVSGGGLEMGQIIGATNSRAEFPKERPLTPQDLLATIYHHLGIDYHTEFKDFTGRPVPILNEGEPIAELV